MGFITKQSLEYDKFKRENVGKTTKQFLFEHDIRMWVIYKPQPEEFDCLLQYQNALTDWYRKKPKK